MDGSTTHEIASLLLLIEREEVIISTIRIHTEIQFPILRLHPSTGNLRETLCIGSLLRTLVPQSNLPMLEIQGHVQTLQRLPTEDHMPDARVLQPRPREKTDPCIVRTRRPFPEEELGE